MKSGRSRPRGVAALAAVALCAAILSPSPAAAQHPAADPWFGRDKALHFGLSAALAGGGYGVSALAGSDLVGRIALGAAIALGAGIAKEAADAAGLGQPSMRDLAWGVVGTAVGLGVAVTVDFAAQGPTFAVVR